jgi:hypothetical protein
MELWLEWWSLVCQLRPAFSRTRSFMWFVVALAGMSVRAELLGVTSIVRALGLKSLCYDRLLDLFHSRAVKLDCLTRLWVGLVLAILKPFVYVVCGRAVLVADGIKTAKSGLKMPAVKKLHQESDNNSKPAFIFGHSCQAVSLVVRAAESFLAVPLACRIHEGIVFSNRDKRSLLDKLVCLITTLGIEIPYYVVADAYYCSRKIIRPLLKAGQHLVAAVRSNAVAYEPVAAPEAPRRGRPKVYGRKIKLKALFSEQQAFVSAASPVYGEKDVTLRYRVIDLLWRPAGCLVRFVLVTHPTRGRKILLATDLRLSALQIIDLYGVRFKIEVGFKQAIHTLGTYAYHFWMSDMTPRPRRSGNQHLHRKPAAYREHVRRKIRAYHAHIQLGVIAQGMLQCLALRCTTTVWRRFGSWLRTVRPGIPPSEFVVAIALRHSLPAFLADSPRDHILAEFIRERIDLSRREGARMLAA